MMAEAGADGESDWEGEERDERRNGGVKAFSDHHMSGHTGERSTGQRPQERILSHDHEERGRGMWIIAMQGGVC
jgi:hypothetical protein